MFFVTKTAIIKFFFIVNKGESKSSHQRMRFFQGFQLKAFIKSVQFFRLITKNGGKCNETTLHNFMFVYFFAGVISVFTVFFFHLFDQFPRFLLNIPSCMPIV